MNLLAQQGGNFSARTSTWADKTSTADLPTDLVSVIEASNKIAKPYDRPYMQNAGEARTAIGELITQAEEGASDTDLKAKMEEVNTTVQGLLDSENSK